LEKEKFGFVLRGPKGEEFPMIVLNTTKEQLGDKLLKNDIIDEKIF
jgi:hypothetical protein